MRLQISKSKNATSYYVIKSYRENGHNSSKVVEKLGTREQIMERTGCEDPEAWARAYIEELNKKEKLAQQEILLHLKPAARIKSGEQKSFNGGYLFLQKIYHELGLHKICKEISRRHSFEYDLNSILSRLLYGRILFPSSKLSTFQQSQKLLEQPDFELHDVYRALSVLAQESDFIQSELYMNSLMVSKRKTGVIFYDCTNFFFETEQTNEGALPQYGVSKEHRPNPIVQMGLFMDADGIPLAFCINPGNTNENITLAPLEKKLLSDFHLSKFVVCTDAGLASKENRIFNDHGNRAFITTQSVKQLSDPRKQWVLSKGGWHVIGRVGTYDISELDDEERANDFKNVVFYKEQWIKDKVKVKRADGTYHYEELEQRLIVTYSIQYRNYQRSIRQAQIERAQKTISSDADKMKKKNANDYRRFISSEACTTDGEIAEHHIYSINEDLIQKEAVYDGFYAVCTNLEDDVSAIIKVNHNRWEIEECFRIMKSEFLARPVYLSRDDRIKAHFTTCFLSLILYRYLEKRLQNRYSCAEIIECLRDMNFLRIRGTGFIPCYTRSALTDDLHKAFGFETDHEVITTNQMKKIYKISKK